MKRKRKLRFTQCETKTCDMELGGKEEGEKLLKEVKVMSFSTMSNVHKAKYNMCVCGSKNSLFFQKNWRLCESNMYLLHVKFYHNLFIVLT